VHAGDAAERPANPGRTPVKERILDTCGQAQDGNARNVINARRTGNAETRATRATTLDGVGAMIVERTARRHLSPRVPACSAGPHSELPSTLPPARVDRQVQRGDGPPRMAQRLLPGMPAGL
jgi:hypothetical protein